MKKTLIALAVLAAGSASAAEIYNQDGVAVTVSGAGEVQLYQAYEKDGEDVSTKLRLDDMQLNTHGTIEVAEGLNAIVGLDFTFEDNDHAEGNVKTDGSYIGFAYADYGTITYGRQYLITDDSGIGADFEVGKKQYGQQTTVGKDVVKYVYDNGTFYFGLSHDLDESEGTTVDATSTDGRVGFRYEGLDARLYIYSGDDVDLTSTTTGDEDSFNLEVTYEMDAFNFAASYGQIEQDDQAGKEVADIDIIELVGSYTMDKTTFSLGYVHNDDDTSNVDGDNIYGVVVYKMNANVRTYAEIGFYDDSTSTDYDPAYTLGMEVKF
ncbi:porin [Vibrio gazogenes]|uniref:Outer membrane protein (Porin) n=1 Tax=Vibrio gazogenes DSM 21264 = NBRC 103151 TaxID=1123492 RepID=A0A1M5DWW9_VIBGA|nr:porin [Vibrio gazogenes]USP14901.1 porin [Vibrio gazogenes]SHF71497.1 Outer membrane protein (porin) [Vibrio gazogenes DSM 21264] [Vibrio gazogenes DSM 21264 = NBRC 103151]